LTRCRTVVALPLPGKLTKLLRYPRRMVTAEGVRSLSTARSMRKVWIGMPAVQAAIAQSVGQLPQLSPSSRRPLPQVPPDADVGDGDGLAVAEGSTAVCVAVNGGVAVAEGGTGVGDDVGLTEDVGVLVAEAVKVAVAGSVGGVAVDGTVGVAEAGTEVAVGVGATVEVAEGGTGVCVAVAGAADVADGGIGESVLVAVAVGTMDDGVAVCVGSVSAVAVSAGVAVTVGLGESLGAPSAVGVARGQPSSGKLRSCWIMNVNSPAVRQPSPLRSAAKHCLFAPGTASHPSARPPISGAGQGQ
jgi:hypothetical protein